MLISIIAAIANNNVIGNNNNLIWKLPADLKYFKEITSGHHVIMGRKNYESIGKPLPNRINIIITRQKEFIAEGCIIVNSLKQAISNISDDEIFIIGGGEIYLLAIPIVKRLYITKIDADFEGDTYFPEINGNEWKMIKKTDCLPDLKNPYNYSFQVYERI